MTQKELAEKLKVAQSAIAQWENGYSGPKRSRLIELADVLDCSIEELLSEEDEKDEKEKKIKN